MMEFIPLTIPGAFEIRAPRFDDSRGSFTKVFHYDFFRENGIIETHFKEEYFSISKKNVLRGMHFQSPPHDHAKLVYPILGKVQDVLLDIRKDSPTYGKAISLDLSDELSNIVYIPKGVAHGFLTLSDRAIMVYKTTTVYCKEHDLGIHWSSCESIWKNKNFIISDRDMKHRILDNFDSPFVLDKELI